MTCSDPAQIYLLVQTLTERSVNYNWGPQIDYVLFESLLIQDGQTFQFKSYWHTPCAGLVRNLHLNKNFTAAGCSGRHGLLKRESVGRKDYCTAKTGNEIRVLESEEWVSWSKGYIFLLRWAWGSSESGTLKKWELQKEINLSLHSAGDLSWETEKPNPAVEKHEPVVCVCWNVLLLLTQNPLDFWRSVFIQYLLSIFCVVKYKLLKENFIAY